MLREETDLYLASDRSVAVAELARHLREGRRPQPAADANERADFRLTLSLERLIDLRGPALLETLGRVRARSPFLSRQVARATARFLRATTSVQGLLVPSMAFLADPSRWVLALFLDALPPDTAEFATAVEPIGLFRVDSESASDRSPPEQSTPNDEMLRDG